MLCFSSLPVSLLVPAPQGLSHDSVERDIFLQDALGRCASAPLMLSDCAVLNSSSSAMLGSAVRVGSVLSHGANCDILLSSCPSATGHQRVWEWSASAVSTSALSLVMAIHSSNSLKVLLLLSAFSNVLPQVIIRGQSTGR